MVYPAQAAGPDVEATILKMMPLWRRRRDWTIRDVRDSLQADVVVLQRPLHHETLQVIPMIQKKGIAVVVELDDDFAALHPHHSMFDSVHPRNPEVNWHHLKRACRLADLVTVTTPALAARYGGAKARVLPNRVPASLLDVTADRDGRTVGWGGSAHTHVRDLTATRGGVAQALDGTDARFLTVGPPDSVREDLDLSTEPETTGGLPFDEYHQALAQLDIGISPLADSIFNAAKSALKLLEYAALGIACVTSPRADYQRLHAEGIGLAAGDRARDWRRQVRRLLDDLPFREETIARSFELVAEHHTYETNAWRWLECWDEAISIRHASRAKAVAA